MQNRACVCNSLSTKYRGGLKDVGKSYYGKDVCALGCPFVKESRVSVAGVRVVWARSCLPFGDLGEYSLQVVPRIRRHSFS